VTFLGCAAWSSEPSGGRTTQAGKPRNKEGSGKSKEQGRRTEGVMSGVLVLEDGKRRNLGANEKTKGRILNTSMKATRDAARNGRPRIRKGAGGRTCDRGKRGGRNFVDEEYDQNVIAQKRGGAAGNTGSLGGVSAAGRGFSSRPRSNQNGKGRKNEMGRKPNLLRSI